MNQNIDHLLELLQGFKSKEPEPITRQHKQAAFTIAEFEECIQQLMEASCNLRLGLEGTNVEPSATLAEFIL